MQVSSITGDAGGTTTNGAFFTGFQYNPSTSTADSISDPNPNMSSSYSGAGAPLLIRNNAGQYQFGTGFRDIPTTTGVDPGTGNAVLGNSRVFAPQLFNVGDTVLLVGKWLRNPGTQDDVAYLFVDPNPTGGEPANADAVSNAATVLNGSTINYDYGYEDQGTGTTPGTLVDDSIRSFFLRNNATEPNHMLVDDVRVGTTWADVVPTSAQPGTWNNPAGGSWQTATNWTANTIPSGDGVSASFDSIITSPQTVSVDASTTIGSITFNNVNRYTIAGPSTLTMQNSSGSASIHVISGNHTISAPLTFASNTTLTVDSASNTLTLTGGVNAASVTTTKTGPGSLAIGGNSNNLGNLAIQQGSVQLLPGMSNAVRTNGLSVSSGATLDLTNNDLIVNYTGSSPIANIRSLLTQGSANNWTGTGITSSTAANNANHTTALGYAEASDLGLSNGGSFDATTIANQAIIIKYTYYGDANLDGVVNLDDFSIFIDGFNGLGSGWIYGDFNYDGVINQSDFSLFVQGYNLNGQPLSLLSNSIMSDPSLSASQKSALLSSVPEPSSIFLLALATALPFLPRRRV